MLYISFNYRELHRLKEAVFAPHMVNAGFNQTPKLTPLQAKAAFGPEIEKFQAIRRQTDPEDRFYNDFFRRHFE